MKTKYYNKKPRLTIATWNVWTLLDHAGSGNPERQTGIVAKELSRYGVDIAALSEVRFSDEDQLTVRGWVHLLLER